jgi:hypothetical protein
MGTGEESVDKLERFFSLIDSSRIFDSIDLHYFTTLRNEIKDSLVQLLVWKRSFLESEKSLNWPYEALKERVSFFKNLSQKESSPMLRHQARLFLALLPFPGQWGWLTKFEKEFRNDAEIDEFFKMEKQKIQAKLRGKRQKQYKLRHFCQILKKPRLPREKGVLRIFSLPYLFIDPTLLKVLNHQYFLYVEPTAGAIFRHTWWRNFSTLEDPFLFGVSSEEDAMFLQSQPGTLTTNLAHGDFMENEVAVDLGKEKHFDIVFNSTFDEMPRKRHNLLLSLLHHPLLRHATALVIGRGKEKNVNNFKQKIDQNGLSHRVTVMSNLRRIDVPKQLAHCQMGVHFSLHENGCRCIYEFFRSDLPCVISSSTAGVNMEIFNSMTGLAVPDKDLPDAISYVLLNKKKFTPRRWFLANSGSYHSTFKLNEQLKAIFQNRGYEWSDDIIPLGSSGANRYLHDSHYTKFRYEFGKLLESFRKLPNFPIKLSLD